MDPDLYSNHPEPEHWFVPIDDLWASVKDGRYKEQKFRMKMCGLPHLYYLIEVPHQYFSMTRANLP